MKSYERIAKGYKDKKKLLTNVSYGCILYIDKQINHMKARVNK
jgi:hypothetical protein